MGIPTPPTNYAISSIAGSTTLATITGVGLENIAEAIKALNTMPVVNYIPIQSSEISCTCNVNVSAILLTSQLDKQKQYITDNAAPQPRTWRITGYIKALNPAIESALITKPTLILQKKCLDLAYKSRMPVPFKDEAGNTFSVFVKELTMTYDSRATNAYAVTMTLQECVVLKNINSNIPETGEIADILNSDEVKGEMLDKLGGSIPSGVKEMFIATAQEVVTGVLLADCVKIMEWGVALAAYGINYLVALIKGEGADDETISEVVKYGQNNYDGIIGYLGTRLLTDSGDSDSYTCSTVNFPDMVYVQNSESTMECLYMTDIGCGAYSLHLNFTFDEDEDSPNYNNWVCEITDVRGELPSRSFVLHPNITYFDGDTDYFVSVAAPVDLDNKELLSKATFYFYTKEQ